MLNILSAFVSSSTFLVRPSLDSFSSKSYFVNPQAKCCVPGQRLSDEVDGNQAFSITRETGATGPADENR